VRVYVAGGFLERDLVREWMGRLREIGVTISHDWTESEASAPGVTSDDQLSAEQAIRYANGDIEGVRSADLVWHIVASYKGAQGSYFETGLAYGLGKLIVVSGPDWRKSIFHYKTHPFDTHAEAFEHIRKFATAERFTLFPAKGEVYCTCGASPGSAFVPDPRLTWRHNLGCPHYVRTP
jgi:hypothetical protein